MQPRMLNSLKEVDGLGSDGASALEEITDRFAFRSNDYYLSLIDWNDPEDPIRRLIIPHKDELEGPGKMDASNEKSYQVMPGMQHKYEDTVILLISDICAGLCRYCFRKRVFIEPEQNQVLKDIDVAVEYIREHTEIKNVLLSGGDPLMLSTQKLENIISKISEIYHLEAIRIGTKMPAFNPYRILDDPAQVQLPEMLGKYVTNDRSIYVVTHFDHPREYDLSGKYGGVAIEGLRRLHRNGVQTVNQTPLIRGVNDNVETLAELFDVSARVGNIPYYVFGCRPTAGNYNYAVPVEEGWEIFDAAQRRVSGLAKKARFVMSHSTGKIEVLGMDEARDYISFKYHRAAKDEDYDKGVMRYLSTPGAKWFDDYKGREAGLDVPRTILLEKPLITRIA